MLTNNYDNSLPENKETSENFLCPVSPKVFIRYFDPRLVPGAHLLIPFMVTDYYQKRYYEEDGHNEDGTIIKKELNETYTTIITFDEYKYECNYVTKEITPTSPLYNKEIKLTTYAGEQAVDVDLFELVGEKMTNSNKDMFNGEHYFSIRCVQNNGSSSVTEYFHFLVEDPNDETTVDLNTINEFSVTLTDTNVEFPTIDYTIHNSAEKIRKEYRKSWYYDPDSKTWKWKNEWSDVAKFLPIGKYTVRVRPTYIEVEVEECETRKLQSGYLYEIPNAQYINSLHTLKDVPKRQRMYGQHDDVKFEEHGVIESNIKGVYRLYSSIEIEGQSYKLSDYTSKYPDTVPDRIYKKIRDAAIMNKVALNRLMEAAKGYAGTISNKSRCKLILPKGLDIVLDRHKLYPSGERYKRNTQDATGMTSTVYTASGYTPITSLADYSSSFEGNNCTPVDPEYYIPPDKKNGVDVDTRNVVSPYMHLWNVDIPNNFTLDLNGATISELQSLEVIAGPLLSIRQCFNSHIINGDVRGAYKDFRYNKIRRTVEYTGNINISSSTFSTYENMEDSYSLGYDAYVGGGDNGRQAAQYNSRAYNKYGYIDNDGVFQGLPQGDRDATLDAYFDIRCNIEDKNNTLTQTLAAINGLMEDLPGAKFDLTRLDDSGGALSSKFYTPELFLHIYGSAETAANKVNTHAAKRRFMKTVKVYDNHPILLPPDLHSCAISSWGVGIPVGKALSDTINHMDGSTVKGTYTVMTATQTYCSGFINCNFYNLLTCYGDAAYCTQCFYKDCTFANIAAERKYGYGGMSGQTIPMDIEDNATTCLNLTFYNCDNIIGKSTFLIQDGLNINTIKLRGWVVSDCKQLGGYQYNIVADDINENQYFTNPYKFNNVDNIMTNTVSHSWGKNYGQAGQASIRQGEKISNSSLLKVDGDCKDNLCSDNCIIYNK